MAEPLRRILAAAPIRICDNGGWTDTWFAGSGKIFNIAVTPEVTVQIDVYRPADWPDGIVMEADNFGDRYVVTRDASGWGRHPLLEAAIALMQPPRDLGLRINIYSEAPSGASTGTSAAVTVALIGALDCLTPGRLTAHEVAYKAQVVETQLLGQQCGIQDQLCAAYGGLNYIEMFSYPYASVSPVPVHPEVWWELERRLALIYLGKSHVSSDIHLQVIRELEHLGPDCPQLRDLRQTAEPSRDAVAAGDLPALGRAMIANTEAQGRLHPALIGADAARVIAIAQAHGALGWKVNGAGGDGGSLTVLCGADSAENRALLQAIQAANSHYRHIPTRLSRRGLRVWEIAVA